jgi:hypothetical protein
MLKDLGYRVQGLRGNFKFKHNLFFIQFVNEAIFHLDTPLVQVSLNNPTATKLVHGLMTCPLGFNGGRLGLAGKIQCIYEKYCIIFLER